MRRGRLPVSVPLVCLFSILFAPTAFGQQPASDAAASRARQEAARERAERVPEILSLAGLSAGAVVADVGAGSGFLTVRLARLVGPGGRVYAVDIEPAAIRALRERVAEEKLENVEVIQGTVDDPKLPRDSLDAIVVLKSYHEMTAAASMLAHMKDALKPTGRLVMVEPASRTVPLDRAAQRDADVLSAQLAEQDLRAAGFQVAELRDPFITGLAGRNLWWLIVAHRAPGVLLAPIRQPGGRLASDGREVVPPAGGNGDITRPDLRVSADDTRSRVDADTAVVVDLRSDAEYRRGHIPGALSMLIEEFDARAAELLGARKPVILYCS